MKRILITTSSFDASDNPALARIASAGFEVMLNPHGRRLTEDEVTELLDNDVVGMIAGVEPLTRRVLTGAKSLRIIARAGIGLDSVDLGAAKELGITVSNTPQAPVAAVAELTVTLMLDLLREVSAADRDLRSGIWKPRMGHLLSAQTVGLIGFGRIGRAVADLLLPFGCKIQTYDPSYAGDVETVSAVSLEYLLKDSNLVSLHLPYDESTRHLINDERLACMRAGAWLINASRGGLVDEAALARALSTGRLAGAALDTFEAEPYRGPLASLGNVVLTCHMGSYAIEGRARMEREAAENLVLGLAAAGLVPDAT